MTTTEEALRESIGAPSNWPSTESLLGDIIDWESGAMDADAEIVFFAYLIRTGNAWRLQGMYGRTAAHYIENEVISENGEIL